MLAWVNRFNRCTVGELDTCWQGSIHDRLRGSFTFRQLFQIEEAFEGGWLRKYPNSRRCLRAIMNNIIRNKGNFNYNDPKDNPERDACE